MRQINNYYKKINFLLFGFFILFISSCSSTKTNVFWVNSIKTECPVSVDKEQCISISGSDETDNAVWELFPQDIEGFIFDFGYFQKIKIKEKDLKKNKTPNDSSLKKYTLIKSLAKKKDPRINLNDIWTPNRINQNSISTKENSPQIEIKLSTMQVFGSNGCNQFNGKIERITSSDIQFGNFSSTRKMCIDMMIPNLFDKAINASVFYKVNNTQLTFFDKNNNETINFIKKD